MVAPTDSIENECRGASAYAPGSVHFPWGGYADPPLQILTNRAINTQFAVPGVGAIIDRPLFGTFSYSGGRPMVAPTDSIENGCRGASAYAPGSVQFPWGGYADGHPYIHYCREQDQISLFQVLHFSCFRSFKGVGSSNEAWSWARMPSSRAASPWSICGHRSSSAMAWSTASA